MTLWWLRKLVSPEVGLLIPSSRPAACRGNTPTPWVSRTSRCSSPNVLQSPSDITNERWPMLLEISGLWGLAKSKSWQGKTSSHPECIIIKKMGENHVFTVLVGCSALFSSDLLVHSSATLVVDHFPDGWLTRKENSTSSIYSYEQYQSTWVFTTISLEIVDV